MGDLGVGREQALEARVAGAAAVHDVEQQRGAGGLEEFAFVEFDEERGHAVGCRGVARIGFEAGTGGGALFRRDCFVAGCVSVDGVGSLSAGHADGVGDQAERGARDLNAVDAERLHARGDGVAASCDAKEHVGGGVVADEEHQFHEIADGESESAFVEEVGERAGARVEVRFLDFDHLIEPEFTVVDFGEELDGERDLHSAGHRESRRVAEGHAASGLDVDGRGSHDAAGDLRDPVQLAFDDGLRILGKDAERRQQGYSERTAESHAIHEIRVRASAASSILMTDGPVRNPQSCCGIRLLRDSPRRRLRQLKAERPRRSPVAKRRKWGGPWRLGWRARVLYSGVKLRTQRLKSVWAIRPRRTGSCRGGSPAGACCRPLPSRRPLSRTHRHSVLACG